MKSIQEIKLIQDEFLQDEGELGYEIVLHRALLDIWLRLYLLYDRQTKSSYGESAGIDAVKRMMLYIREHLAVVSLLYLVFGCRTGVRAAFCLSKRCLLYALAGSAALSFAMKLLVTLLKHVPASVLYPIQNSAILVLLVLLSAVHLKDRIGKYTRIGIAFALAGIAALGL